MMRAWSSRRDTVVCDEPLYAYYLQESGAPHPGREDVIASQPTDWREVVARLTGPLPVGKRVYFQKHMTHHLLPGVGRDWLRGMRHLFLIRNPREMLLSLSAVLAAPGVADTGLPQQAELYDWVIRECGDAAVLDAADVLRRPEPMLRALCRWAGVAFDRAMLAWEPGRRETDGVWAPYWYASVERSTGFEPYRERRGELPIALLPVLEACEAAYSRLYERRLQPEE